MNDRLNAYGDKLVETTGSHGADIASQRLDDLDRRVLSELLVREDKPVCLDLGCGLGWQGVRFALLGGRAYLFDQIEESALVKQLKATPGLSLSYVSADLRALSLEHLPAQVSIAFSQRFIHYLRYPEARRLLSLVGTVMPAQAKFYLSASGIDSELGDGYVGRSAAVAERFARLSTPMQDKHDIREPVCLYNERELEQLMSDSGFSCVETKRSTFGNIKGVFQKRA